MSFLDDIVSEARAAAEKAKKEQEATKEAPVELPPQPPFLDSLGSALARGTSGLSTAATGLGYQLGLKSPESMQTALEEQAKVIQANPPSPAFAQFQNAPTFGESFATAVANPSIVPELILESAPTSLAALGAGAVGGATAGPLGFAGGIGGISGGAEAGGVISDILQKEGVNIADRDAVIARLRQPDFIQKAQERGLTSGAIIGTTEALLGAGAGRIVEPIKEAAEEAGKRMLGKQILGYVGEAGVQGVGAGASEAAKQIALDQKITQPGAVLGEALAEGAFGTVEAATGLNFIPPKPKIAKTEATVAQAETAAANELPATAQVLATKAEAEIKKPSVKQALESLEEEEISNEPVATELPAPEKQPIEQPAPETTGEEPPAAINPIAPSLEGVAPTPEVNVPEAETEAAAPEAVTVENPATVGEAEQPAATEEVAPLVAINNNEPVAPEEAAAAVAKGDLVIINNEPVITQQGVDKLEAAGEEIKLTPEERIAEVINQPAITGELPSETPANATEMANKSNENIAPAPTSAQPGVTPSASVATETVVQPSEATVSSAGETAPVEQIQSGSTESRSSAPALSDEEARTGEAESRPAPIARVRLGKSPQTYEVVEQLPPQPGDLPEETYYRVRNERTGETQVIEARDATPVKGSAPLPTINQGETNALNEIVQPESIQQEPEGGTESRKAEEASSGNRIQRPAQGQEEVVPAQPKRPRYLVSRAASQPEFQLSVNDFGLFVVQYRNTFDEVSTREFVSLADVLRWAEQQAGKSFEKKINDAFLKQTEGNTKNLSSVITNREIPEGYAKQGDLYVYQPTAPDANALATRLLAIQKKAIAAAEKAGATDAELAASEALTEVVDGVTSGKYKAEDAEKSYVQRARKRGLDQAKSEKATKRGGGKAESLQAEETKEPAAEQPTPAQQAVSNEEEAALTEAMKVLTPLEKDVIIRIRGGQSAADIARAKNTTQQNISKAYTSAIKKLQAELKKTLGDRSRYALDYLPTPKALGKAKVGALLAKRGLLDNKNFRVVEDPSPRFDGKQWSMRALPDGTVEINALRQFDEDKFDADIDHELAHLAERNPTIAARRDEFLAALTPQERAAVKKWTDRYNEGEKATEEFAEMLAVLKRRADAYNAWQKFLRAIEWILSATFGLKTSSGNLALIAQDLINGQAGSRVEANGVSYAREYPVASYSVEDKSDLPDPEAGSANVPPINLPPLTVENLPPNMAQSQVYGNENTGGVYEIRKENAARQLIQQQLFNGTDTPVTPESQEYAWNLATGLLDEDGESTQAARALDNDLGIAMLKQELFKYGARVMAETGDPSFVRWMARKKSLMRSAGTEGGQAAAMAADSRFNFPLGKLFSTQEQAAVEEAASILTGTKPKKGTEASKENLNTFQELVDIIERLKGQIADIRDILSGVKTASGKDLETLVNNKVSKRRKAKPETPSQDPDRAAQAMVDRLAKIQSDTPSFSSPKQELDVTNIVRQDLRNTPDLKRKEVWKSALLARLKKAGVSDPIAETLTDLVWRQHEISSANRAYDTKIKALERGSLTPLIERIENTPLAEQQKPEWIKQTAIDYFREIGLSREEAEAAATVFESAAREKVAEAQVKAAERFVRQQKSFDERLKKNPARAKSDLDKILQAVRNRALDPTTSFAEELAKTSGWTKLTPEQFKRVAELDQEITSLPYNNRRKAAAQKELLDIIDDSGAPARFRDVIDQFYIAQALQGISTLAVNIYSPAAFAIQNLLTDVTASMMQITDPINAAGYMANSFYKFTKAWDGYLSELVNAIKTNSFEKGVNENLQDSASLRKLLRQGLRDLKSNKPPMAKARAFFNILVGINDYALRMLGALDQAALTMRQQAMETQYFTDMFRRDGMNEKEIGETLKALSKQKQEVYDLALGKGMSRSEAGVIANEYLQNAWLAQSEKLGFTARDIAMTRLAALNDSLYEVGRKGKAGLGEAEEIRDAGTILGPLAMWFVDGMENMARQSPAASLAVRAVAGFFGVPARALWKASWWSPIGFLRILKARQAQKRGIENPYAQSLSTEAQYTQRWREAAAGTIVYFLASALFKSSDDADKEKPKFAIVMTGDGPPRTSPAMRDAWAKNGWKPFSLTFVFGDKKVSLNIGRGGEALFFPLTTQAALDDYKLAQKARALTKKAELPPLEQGIAAMSTVASGVYNALALRGPLSPLKNALDFFMEPNTGKFSLEQAASSAVFAGKTLIPVAGGAIVRNLTQLATNPIDKSSQAASIFANAPIIGPIVGQPALNAMGDPIRDQSLDGKLWSLGIPAVLSLPDNSSNRKFYELIGRNGVAPATPRRSDIERKVGFPISDPAWTKYGAIYGKTLSELTQKNIDRLDAADVAEFKVLVDKLDDKARKAALKELEKSLPSK